MVSGRGCGDDITALARAVRGARRRRQCFEQPRAARFLVVFPARKNDQFGRSSMRRATSTPLAMLPSTST
jgi:hypothetical protein